MGKFVTGTTTKILNVNEFYCGLHFLVGMADQAEACLKVWEGILFKDDNNIDGSLKHGGYSNRESGTTRLIRTVCKTMQQRGCEKSERMASFETFMKEEFGMTELPLFPFLGNRFNILFLNGAGTFYLYEKLVDFFKKINLDNKLLSSVHWDLGVIAYRVGCRALGLIEKLVSGPLWKIISKEKQILNMSAHYQDLLSFFEVCADDASAFMKGDKTFCDFAFVNQDACYRKLITPDELIDDMTKQALEIIFNGLAVVTRQMLHDHVGDGKFANGRNDQELVKETQSVDTTNVEAKQDFGMLDRLMKLKPKALDIVHESIIMFTRNKTGEWRDKLSEENLKKAMNFTKNSKKQQKLMYLAKKK